MQTLQMIVYSNANHIKERVQLQSTHPKADAPFLDASLRMLFCILNSHAAKSLTYLKEPSTPRCWQQFKPEPWWYNSSCIVAFKGVHTFWMRWHTTTCKHPPTVNYIRTGRWVGQRLHGNNYDFIYTLRSVFHQGSRSHFVFIVACSKWNQHFNAKNNSVYTYSSESTNHSNIHFLKIIYFQVDVVK